MQLTNVKKEMRAHKTKAEEQARIIAEYTARLDDHDKKFDESARKFTTVLQVRSWTGVIFGWDTGLNLRRGGKCYDCLGLMTR